VNCELVCIRGNVQGVCFRYYARREAERLGISGWVRNRSDGSVEALICGSERQLSAMRKWLSRGPPSAEVHQTDTHPWQGPSPDTGFRIAY